MSHDNLLASVSGGGKSGADDLFYKIARQTRVSPQDIDRDGPVTRYRYRTASPFNIKAEAAMNPEWEELYTYLSQRTGNTQSDNHELFQVKTRSGAQINVAFIDQRVLIVNDFDVMLNEEGKRTLGPVTAEAGVSVDQSKLG